MGMKGAEKDTTLREMHGEGKEGSVCKRLEKTRRRRVGGWFGMQNLIRLWKRKQGSLLKLISQVGNVQSLAKNEVFKKQK